MPLSLFGRAVVADLRVVAVLLALAVLAALPYLPALSQPFISDDYVQIDLGRRYGAVADWGALLRDPLYHARATSIVLTHWTERLFGTSPTAFYATGIVLHVVNTWLVFLLGTWRRIGWRLSAVAAGFFGVYLGHQEAVMWYASLPELLLFFFAIGFVLLWLKWIESGRMLWYGAAVLCFALALLSKEAAVVLAPIAVMIALIERAGTPRLQSAAPLLIATAIYAFNIFAAKSEHLHFNDGTFSLHAPFVTVWMRSVWRMLFVWGLVSLIAVTAWREWKQWRGALALAAVWTAITLLPYCFLTYMPQIPSRHTYLPSAGLALLVGAGMLTFERHFGSARRWATAALWLTVALHHAGYIVVWKRPQFLERAAPTERLLELARTAPAAIHVHCFPYAKEVAQLTLQIAMPKGAPKLIWSSVPPSEPHVVYCAE